ncbi:glycogen synthase GlgA [Bordetella sp. 15P40C-2]|uniref:glycogen synthase GlgA n=1 Tax=Bordetella sp. 15P40C-2 TaxID=2572246 RepID=UPI00132632EC|nr:glycogen synthase GlgA [Bordetella sp. 15P40C-2]MVW73200.1 glycogen synthase GlgA [Bordetella sp. 15P40C-2]
MSSTVLLVAGEAYPLVKTGGLADAVTGLVQALEQAGVQVRLLVPAYRGVLEKVRVDTTWPLPDLPQGPARLVAGRCRTTGMSCLLLDHPALFDRPGCYVDENGQDYADNASRFAALAHAAAEVARGLPGLERPTIVHAHDWHAGLVPLLIKAAELPSVKTVLTIHNLAFQGVFDLACIDQLGLPESARHAEGLYAWDRLNFLQAGILHADRVTTVSHTYAREILTPEFGCGLEGALRYRGEALVALPNGIDDELWNPATNVHLQPNGFSASNLGNKARWKEHIQRAFGLTVDPGALLVVSCCRLTEQKMTDLTVEALPRALAEHPRLQFALLGKGDRRFEEAFTRIAAEHPGRCGVRIGYDEPTAHRLQAGADMLWHPSRFEPFGLTPLYSMRYGTLPIVTAVGGLADSIKDPGSHAGEAAMMRANGLFLEHHDVDGVVAVLARALQLRSREAVWRAMRRNAMNGAYGWNQRVTSYLDLFETLSGDGVLRDPSGTRSRTQVPPSAASA